MRCQDTGVVVRRADHHSILIPESLVSVGSVFHRKIMETAYMSYPSYEYGQAASRLNRLIEFKFVGNGLWDVLELMRKSGTIFSLEFEIRLVLFKKEVRKWDTK